MDKWFLPAPSLVLTLAYFPRCWWNWFVNTSPCFIGGVPSIPCFLVTSWITSDNQILKTWQSLEKLLDLEILEASKRAFSVRCHRRSTMVTGVFCNTVGYKGYASCSHMPTEQCLARCRGNHVPSEVVQIFSWFFLLLPQLICAQNSSFFTELVSIWHFLEVLSVYPCISSQVFASLKDRDDDHKSSVLHTRMLL